MWKLEGRAWSGIPAVHGSHVMTWVIAAPLFVSSPLENLCLLRAPSSLNRALGHCTTQVIRPKF